MSAKDGTEYRVIWHARDFLGRLNPKARRVTLKQTLEGAQKTARWASTFDPNVRIERRDVTPWEEVTC